MTKGGVLDSNSTRELIHRIRAGDARAETELFQRFLPILTRWARGRVPTRSRNLVETDDLVQVTLSRAFKRLSTFDPKREGAFLAYLHRILINCIRDTADRGQRQPWQEPVDTNRPDERTTLLEDTMGSDMVGRYESALLELTEEQQHGVILRLEFGLAYKDIAEALGARSPDAVRMQVGRSVVRLAQLMGHSESGLPSLGKPPKTNSSF